MQYQDIFFIIRVILVYSCDFLLLNIHLDLGLIPLWNYRVPNGILYKTLLDINYPF